MGRLQDIGLTRNYCTVHMYKDYTGYFITLCWTIAFSYLAIPDNALAIPFSYLPIPFSYLAIPDSYLAIQYLLQLLTNCYHAHNYLTIPDSYLTIPNSYLWSVLGTWTTCRRASAPVTTTPWDSSWRLSTRYAFIDYKRCRCHRPKNPFL
jgi:hypothetical protein